MPADGFSETHGHIFSLQFTVKGGNANVRLKQTFAVFVRLRVNIASVLLRVLSYFVIGGRGVGLCRAKKSV
ncbi:MAG: hypothetical protein JWO95_1130 [Verrucomicrobiales bacterium]|nr:hypothetical protein [Verrucomicrobiales bacterium]